MVTVGITGGIGSGKTTVCKVWADLGAYIVNADDLAKQVMVEDPKVRQRLLEAFGEAVYVEDGSLNRNFLAREAFGKGRVEELNAIVHPRMPQAVLQKKQEAERAGYPVMVYEAALLLENLEAGRLDYLVLVLADEKNRIRRVRRRDGSTVTKIRQRMEKQRDFAKAADQVDFVINNDGTLADLRKKAAVIYQNFLSSKKTSNNDQQKEG